MYDDRTNPYSTKPMSLSAYCKMKLKALKNDFRITLTEEELKKASILTTEIQIDQFCLGIINKRWG